MFLNLKFCIFAKKNSKMQNNIIGSKKEGNKRICLKFCVVCSEVFTSVHVDTHCCGANCRNKLLRLTKKNEAAIFNRSNFVLPALEDIEDLGFEINEISLDIRSKVSK
ncbi:MAG TPA: hypothetical protein DCS19_07425 [Flavobacterium sp.]|nr:hypothetical protein [Flavobacterium sp.]